MVLEVLVQSNLLTRAITDAAPSLATMVAQETLLLGEDFLPWMVLAFGAALVVGPLLALVRPPKGTTDGTAPTRPPVARTIVMIVIGAVAAIWGLASLLA